MLHIRSLNSTNVLILLVILVIAVSAVQLLSNSDSNDKLTIAIPQNAVVYTDEESVAMLRDEGQYAMTDLVRQEVYLVDGELNVDFWFDEGVKQNQIDSARSFVITRFVLRSGQGAFLGAGPYTDIIKNKEITWKTVSCRIYTGDEQVSYEAYNDKGQLINQ